MWAFRCFVMSLSIFIFAGGKSSRFGGKIPKLFQDLGGKAVIHHVLDAAAALSGLTQIYVVCAPEFLEWSGWPKSVILVPQEPALGTGHAFQLAFQSFMEHSGCAIPEHKILVLMGDCPLALPNDFSLILEHPSDFTLLGMYPDIFRRYGKIYRDASGRVYTIEEHKHTPSETLSEIPLCYTGVMKIRADLAKDWSTQLRFRKEVQEYYITDFVEISYEQKKETGLVVSKNPKHFIGINTKEDWHAAYQFLQGRWRQKALEQGALLYDPDTVTLSWDTHFSQDVCVHPFNVFGPGVRVEEGATIHSFCHLSNVTIDVSAEVGPFARIRDESYLGCYSKIGSFVEVKNSSIGTYAQAKHLAYLGNTTVEKDVNIGAGVVTCNYDGENKHDAIIKEAAFVGAGSMLVAPITVGVCSTVGAGSVITQDVPDYTLAVERALQVNIPLREGSRHLKRKIKSKKETI